MASFKRLSLDQLPAKKIDVNLDLIIYIEPYEDYTRLIFVGNHVDVREKPDEIMMMKALRSGTA